MYPTLACNTNVSSHRTLRFQPSTITSMSLHSHNGVKASAGPVMRQCFDGISTCANIGTLIACTWSQIQWEMSYCTVHNE
eukprot:11150-Heterococcus_DN1.PRE.1